MLDNGEVLTVCRAIIGFAVNLSGGFCGQTIWVAAVYRLKNLKKRWGQHHSFWFTQRCWSLNAIPLWQGERSRLKYVCLYVIYVLSVWLFFFISPRKLANGSRDRKVVCFLFRRRFLQTVQSKLTVVKILLFFNHRLHRVTRNNVQFASRMAARQRGALSKRFGAAVWRELGWRSTPRTSRAAQRQ